MAAICQNYQVLPSEVLDLTLADMRLLTQKPEDIDTAFRYAQMSEDVRAKADALQDLYGGF